MNLEQAEGFQTDATTSEDFYKYIYRHTVNKWSQAGLIAPSIGTTSPINDDDVSDFDSMLTNLHQLRQDQYREKGGFASDNRMTPTSQSYAQRRYDFISRLEGVREYAYDDTEGLRTVGVGFNLDDPANKELFTKTLGGGDDLYNDVRDGKQKLTPAQVRSLFDASVGEAERTLDAKIGKETALPESKRLALLSLAFNGPSLLGPKITSAIKAGDDQAVLDEILNNSNRKRHRGVANRRYQEAQMYSGYVNTASALPNYKDYIKDFA